MLRPADPGGVAAELASAREQGHAVRIAGRGTKAEWGLIGDPTQRRLQTTGLARTLEIDAEAGVARFQAGVPLTRAQAELAARGLMLALDPALGAGDRSGATIGGTVATGDSGPLRHRFGEAADQVAAIQVALPDGRVVDATPEGAERELARLCVGAHGTLGVLTAVTVHVRPLPTRSVTAVVATDDASALDAVTRELALTRSDLDGLDFAWRGGRGGVLARCSGEDCEERAIATAVMMRRAGLRGASVTADDAELWARQRAGQRSRTGTVVRVSARPGSLPALLALTDQIGAVAVGRAATVTAYVTTDVNRVAPLRAGLPEGAHATVLDIPSAARGAVPAWEPLDPPLLDYLQSLKRRFDPGRTCNPGVFVGGI